MFKLKDDDMRTERELKIKYSGQNKFKIEIIIIIIVVIIIGIAISRIVYNFQGVNKNIPQSEKLQEMLKEEKKK